MLNGSKLIEIGQELSFSKIGTLKHFSNKLAGLKSIVAGLGIIFGNEQQGQGSDKSQINVSIRALLV